MSTQAADETDSTSDAAAGRATRPAPGAPRPPVPPRSRLADHLLTGVLAPLLTAGALWFFARGAAQTAHGRTGAADYPDGVWALTAAALLLAAVALSARWSTVGLSISGGLVLAAGVVAWAWPAGVEMVLDPAAGTVPSLRDGLELLLATGTAIVLGAVMSALAAGVHGARRAGRARERSEAALTPARGAGSPPRTAPVPPRSRAGAHTAAVIGGVLLPPLAVLVLYATTPILADAGVREAPGEAALQGLAALVLALVAGSVAVSSIGALVGGALWGLGLGSYLLLRGPDLPGLDALGLGESAGSVELATIGVLPVVGAVLVAGAVAAHEARRAGARHERAELAARPSRG
ncbi:hypothetical protein [Georgenia faecalis]|uniref:Uncharacterized protein n=1 Tax=Georgenia faecalis TaxID=2483799 RepID=A0ABV9D4V8_9MICO|nr:hypothetical protein [Georgenia faecalis]